MTKLTTPKSILIGFALIALSIASIPYSNLIVPKAYAGDSNVIQRILYCLDHANIQLSGAVIGSSINLNGNLITYCDS